MLSKSNETLRLALSLGWRVTDEGECMRPDGTPQRVYADKDGYACFGLPRSALRCKTVRVHRLAILQRLGEDALFARGVHVRHLDGDVTNNSLSNLTVGSVRQNYEDKTSTAHRRSTDAAREASRGLSDHDIQRALSLRKQGASYREISEALGLSSSTIAYLMTGRTYSSITGITFKPRKTSGCRSLDSETARSIYLAYRDTGMSQSEVATRFGVSLHIVNQIVRGLRYADATSARRSA
jgi:transposase